MARRRDGEVSPARLARLAAAREAVELPEITFPPELPVSQHRREIADAIAAHQVVIVAGETGSGKTTQIPKILLTLGRGRAGQLGHTQPRRIAARSVAERIAEELDTPLGEIVGYQVRFTDHSSDATLIKVMTDGILLAGLARDPNLLAYDTIIIDEAHERSLNIDFLLGYLAKLLPFRPDLKLIITSATIDSERFAAHFSPANLARLAGAEPAVVAALPPMAPIIEVTGRTYPVEVRYRPLLAESSSPNSGSPEFREAKLRGGAPGSPEFREAKLRGGATAVGVANSSRKRVGRNADKDLITGVIEACDELMAEGPGDILVFLTGEREIKDATDALAGHLGARATDPRAYGYTEIVPLYARLPAADQHRVFAPHAGRRIILATNVAETSLTVPGIHYVVDSGLARISRFSKTTKVQRLPIEPISQASANQRSGRSGRVANGIAIRLYSESDYDSRDEFTEPEILRTSLAAVLLQMLAVGVVVDPEELATFPFVQAPNTKAVRDGVALLRELGALRLPNRAVEAGPEGQRLETTVETANAKIAGRARNDTMEAAAPNSHSGAWRPHDDTARNLTNDDDDDAPGLLTEIGRQIAALPIDPRLARMLIAGVANGVGAELAVIVAALTIQDPRERPVEAPEVADQLHARFTDPTSDFLTYLNLWNYLREQRKQLSGSAFRRLCKSEHIHYLRVREWQDLVTQIKSMAKEIGLRIEKPSSKRVVEAGLEGQGLETTAEIANAKIADAGQEAQLSRNEDHSTAAPKRHSGVWRPVRDTARNLIASETADAIHMSVLTGLLSNIGMQEAGTIPASAVAHLRGEARARALRRAAKRARNEYRGARGIKFALWPGSPVSKKPPAWVVAAELVETSRLWGRVAARINPDWIEPAAAHLVRRTYNHPHWSSKRGAAFAVEKVLLYGLPVIADRKILYSRVDAPAAREMFIRHALVAGEWDWRDEFYRHNRAHIKQLEQTAARSRQRQTLIDEEYLFNFYDERLPDSVTSAQTFDKWWRAFRKERPGFLNIDEPGAPGFSQGENLGRGDSATSNPQLDPAAFPDAWPQGEYSLPLTYQFAPGTDADGVTAHVTPGQLPHLTDAGFDWLVPGLLTDLCTATIRALPKATRVQLVPAPETGRRVADWLRAHTPAWADMARAGDMADTFATDFARAVKAVTASAPPPTSAAAPAEHAGAPAQSDPSHSNGPSGADATVGPRMIRPESGTRGLAALQGLKDSPALAASPGALAPWRASLSLGTPGVVVDTKDAEAAAARLPAHLRMRFELADARGNVLGHGDSLRALQARFAAARPGANTVAAALQRAGAQASKTGGQLLIAAPAHNQVVEAGLKGQGLETTATSNVEAANAKIAGRARKDSFNGSRDDAGTALISEADFLAGVRELLLSELRLPTARVTTKWTAKQAVAMAASPYRDTDQLAADLQVAAITALTDPATGVVNGAELRTHAQVAEAVEALRPRLEAATYEVASDVAAALAAARELDKALGATKAITLLGTATQIRAHADSLIYNGFIRDLPPSQLKHFARYLIADKYRLEKAGGNVARDQSLAARLAPLEAEVHAALAASAEFAGKAANATPARPNHRADGANTASAAANAQAARWLLEELRVSYFAQQLGTAAPASEQRIRKLLR